MYGRIKEVGSVGEGAIKVGRVRRTIRDKEGGDKNWKALKGMARK